MLLCAIAVLGGLVRVLAAGPAAGGTPVPGWQTLLDSGRTSGPVDAPVRIVEFSDFQCPYCASAQTALAGLRARYPGRIAVVYRHLPLTQLHPFALGAALASECARDQGRFDAYHDALFAGQARIGKVPWTWFAGRAGVPDTAAFAECERARRHRDRVGGDVRHARRLGISGTPVFIIEGLRIDGSLNATVVDSIVQARLRHVAASGRHAAQAPSPPRPDAGRRGLEHLQPE